MSETAEGVGGRKWSLGRREDNDVQVVGKMLGPVTLLQGKTPLAELTAEGQKVQALLVTVPQLWAAANQAILRFSNEPALAPLLADPALKALADMVAKSVGKTDWQDVLQ